MPYDFRKSIVNNDLNKIFEKNIDRLFEITNKKIIVMGHSYGGPNGYY